jgi:hypothetical protein
MLLLSLMLAVPEDPAAVRQDAKCAAVLLAARDTLDTDGRKEESAAAEAAGAYYVGKLMGYYATLPSSPFAPVEPGHFTRLAVSAASRKLDKASLESEAKACYRTYDRVLASL